VARHRARWIAYQGKIDPERLVFIDESWVKTNMAPIRGWCAWQAPRRACALRPLEDIDISGRAVTGLKRRASSTARSMASGSLLMSSKFSFRHCGQATLSRSTIWEAIKAGRFGTPFAPPAPSEYSCRPTRPISTPSILRRAQEVFAKLKHLMRKAGERTIDAAWNRLGTSLDSFSPQERANYFRNAGYAS
jgi:hypothetical protein